MSEEVRKRFSNVQLLLLELFSEDLSEEELREVKHLLSGWRFKRATEAANRVLEEKGWTKEDFDRLLGAHLRTPYANEAP